MPPVSRIDLSRRRFVLSGSALTLLGACSATQWPAGSSARAHTRSDATFPRAQRALEIIEESTDGRIGVAAINLADGSVLMHREHERFAMCSTFKWLLGAVVLQNVENGTEQLNRPISWTADDLISWSPITKPLVEASDSGTATLSVGELCHATLSISDNTAANLLLDTMGGPQGLTQAVRAFGDNVTRLDRYEPELNENAPDDVRDTSTPHAMLALMQTVLFGSVLSMASTAQLKEWMMANVTGNSRLRAGLPEKWTVGDRTGTSSNNANNNLAFAIAPADSIPANGPLLIVSFTNAPNPMTPEANVVHARIARLISNTLL